MTVEELKEKIKPYFKDEALEKEEVWNEINESVDAVVKDTISGVINKKEELLREKKKVAEEYKSLQDKVQYFVDNDITAEQYTQLNTELEDLKKNSSSTSEDIKEVQERFYEQGKRQMQQELSPKLKDYETRVKDFESQVGKLSKKYRDTLKKNAINDVLSSLNVEADSIWLAGFYNQAEDEYIETEDKMSIQVPNPQDPSGPKIPIGDWGKLFPQTPVGKKMIRAPKNSGGGAHGSEGNPAFKKSIKDTLSDMFDN